MQIRLKPAPRAEWETVEIEKGMKLSEIADKFSDKTEHQIILAKVGNKIDGLNKEIDEPADIELLDIRNQAANLAYQNSLIFIYLKACDEVLGSDVKIMVEHSLSKGLFTIVERPVTKEEVYAIEARMREIVNRDLPFEREILNAEEAKLKFEELGKPEDLELLGDKKLRVPFFTLDGYTDFVYGRVVPSTGYIKIFELVRYRKGIIVRFPHPSAPDELLEYVEEYKMYDVFGETASFNELMGVSYLSDLNYKTETGEINELIALSEALQEKKVANIADMVKESGKRAILIAGPSSSGKTSFARRLCIQMKVLGLKPLYLCTDDYFVDRKDAPLDQYGEPDYENLGALDVALFNDDMNRLLRGEETDIPEFDFLKGEKVFGKRITTIDESQPIVIEGIHALNDELTPEIPMGEKFKIYISPFTLIGIDRHNRVPTTDARLLRRMARDARTRGHSPKDTIKSWPKVRAGEDRNIFPYSNCADVLFNSAHIYELGVIKKYVYPLLDEVKPEDSEYSEAQRLKRLLSFVTAIEDDSCIVNNSILREFIGGSVFVD